MVQESRNYRQSEVLPRINRVKASVIGCGSVGRQVAMQLSAIGCKSVFLYDPDKINKRNIGSQGWQEDSVGKYKVDILISSMNHLVEEDTSIFSRKFCKEDALYCEERYVFCCVDSIDDRVDIWNWIKDSVCFWCDARVSTDIARILTVDDPVYNRRYEKTFFSGDEAYEGSCSASNSIYVAYVASGIMISQLSKNLRGIRVDHDLTVNLLSNEITGA